MNATTRLLAVFMVTVVCGAGVITFETPLNYFLLICWGAGTFGAVNRIRQRAGNKSAALVAALHTTTMVAIIVAGALAPVKRIDAVLEQTVQLETEQMTVAQLSAYCRLNRKTLPLTIYIPASGEAANSV